MPETIEASQDVMVKIKQAINEFKTTLGTYFENNNIEVKDWKFAVQNSESSYIIDASVKIQIKPKEKASTPTT